MHQYMHLGSAEYLDYGAAAGEGAKELGNINLARSLFEISCLKFCKTKYSSDGGTQQSIYLNDHVREIKQKWKVFFTKQESNQFNISGVPNHTFTF